MEINELKAMAQRNEFCAMSTTELTRIFTELNNSIANMSAADIGTTMELITLVGREIETRGQN